MSDKNGEEKVEDIKDEIEMKRAILQKIEDIERKLEQKESSISVRAIKKKVEEINEKIKQEKIRKGLEFNVIKQLEEIMAKLDVKISTDIPGMQGSSKKVRDVLKIGTYSIFQYFSS